MLLSDLDGILAKGELDKRDIARQIEEVENANEFFQEQLKSSVNQVLTKNVATLNEEIRILKISTNKIPPIKLKWKFNYILPHIHELCTIEEGASPYKDSILKSSFIQKGKGKLDCLDFCYDKQDKKYYLVNQTTNYPEYKRGILILDSKFNIVSSHGLESALGNCYIKTSSNFIFIHYGRNLSTIMRIHKSHINYKRLTVSASVYCYRFDVFGDHLFVPSLNHAKENNILTLNITDLKVVQHIPINKAYTKCRFVDIRVTKSEIYLLLNSSKERSLQCIDHSGTFLREIISNTRGLQNPLSFCFDKNGNILIADGKIRVFNKFGRQIDSFGEEVEDYTIWAKCVAWDGISDQVMVLADHKGKFLHIY
ncbi:hypothetical protein LOD99_15400 [Oopsacas minuta]|uniref:Uncharacterized protein n=1 Tax=Oopsacas minuta TaxID=111878 RepID=A0AAV7KD28_9METZ|nr:hypothetical protein LOD99_15400 [Oopsacas minuta]